PIGGGIQREKREAGKKKENPLQGGPRVVAEQPPRAGVLPARPPPAPQRGIDPGGPPPRPSARDPPRVRLIGVRSWIAIACERRRCGRRRLRGRRPTQQTNDRQNADHSDRKRGLNFHGCRLSGIGYGYRRAALPSVC